MTAALPWDVLWNRLIAITDEQAAALIRTALTPAVSEAGDLFLARMGNPDHSARNVQPLELGACGLAHRFERPCHEAAESSDLDLRG